MSGIKTLLGDGATGVDDFDLGENYGRYAMGLELLPLLKDALFDLRTSERPTGSMRYTVARLKSAIADIERAPLEAPTEPVGTLSAVNDVTF